MRGTNILTIVAALAWFGLAMIGLSLMRGVILQNVPGYPSNAQIQYYVLYPFGVVAFLACSAWLCNRFMRRPALLGCVSGTALFAVLVYLLGYSGGV